MRLTIIIGILIFCSTGFLKSQNISGIWCSQNQKEILDFTNDGRFKIFGKDYVRYGRYCVRNGFLHLKEIGNSESARFSITKLEGNIFGLENRRGEVIEYAYFEKSKLTQQEYTRALRLYYLRDNVEGLDLVNREVRKQLTSIDN